VGVLGAIGEHVYAVAVAELLIFVQLGRCDARIFLPGLGRLIDNLPDPLLFRI
jgi:hypothetical protein